MWKGAVMQSAAAVLETSQENAEPATELSTQEYYETIKRFPIFHGFFYLLPNVFFIGWMNDIGVRNQFIL